MWARCPSCRANFTDLFALSDKLVNHHINFAKMRVDGNKSVAMINHHGPACVKKIGLCHSHHSIGRGNDRSSNRRGDIQSKMGTFWNIIQHPLATINSAHTAFCRPLPTGEKPILRRFECTNSRDFCVFLSYPRKELRAWRYLGWR